MKIASRLLVLTLLPAPFILLILAFLMMPPAVLAGTTLEFGTDDTIKEIQELPGTNYKLCYHYHIYYFMAGIYLANDGYVLTEEPDPATQKFLTEPAANRYIPLTKEKTNELQQAGLLPYPLPKYSIPTSAYVEGFLMWGILLISFVSLSLKSWIRRLLNWYSAPDP